MHTKLLSNKERSILQKFIETGEKDDPNFRMLKTRIIRNYQVIADDFALITKAQEIFRRC